MMRLLFLLIVAFSLTACENRREDWVDQETPAGESEPDRLAPPEQQTTSEGAQQGMVEVEIVDYDYNMPNTVASGAVRFMVTNSGSKTHGFAIEGYEQELKLEPGETGELSASLTAGTYRIYCPVSDHAKGHGMELALTVE